MVADEKPQARPLDVIPVEVQGKQAIYLRDPLGFSADVVITPVVYFFLAQCDGNQTLADIKLAFVRQFGVILAPRDALQILAELDRHYLLDNERFHQRREQIIQGYRAEKVRQPSHVGAAYPGEPDQLCAELNSYYTCPQGPGGVSEVSGASQRQLVGLIAPHISVRQGGPCFAWAYKRLRESQPVETFVILGTGHAPVEGCFAATRKAFQTPLGSVEVDGELLDRLEGYCGGDLCAEEIHHRSEHVIEFQLIFLQHALADREHIKIVPILCSFAPEHLVNGTEFASERAAIERFCEALRRTLADTPGPVCVICSADLAHIGWRYGDPVTIGTPEQESLEREDRRMIEIICSGNADGFLENLTSDGNRRRICGFPCIYPMLRALELKDGEVLQYGQSDMDEHHSTVSYASVAFYK